MLQTRLTAPPTWKLCLWIAVLALCLTLLIGVVVGAIGFLRWRALW